MIMLRLLFPLLLAVVEIACQVDYGALNNTFQLKTAIGKVVTLPGCNGVEGTTSGCSECYICTDPTILYYKDSGNKIDTFQLKDTKCHSTSICCIAQYDFLSGERSSSECGKANPNGYPRRRRPSPRANLPGEYPWRAWIYKRSRGSAPLCASTYVHTRVVVTLAQCVHELAAESLGASFVRGGDDLHLVEEVLIHHKWKPGSGTDNIAAIKLSQFTLVPRWVQVSCFPPAPPVHAASCQTVSATDKTINSVIPLQERCSKTGEAPDVSKICAVAPRGDYVPEKGAGLYCVQQYGNQPAYLFYGIAQSTDNNSVTQYTNVSLYRSWIETTLSIKLF